jgi:hypothetical protein
MYGLGDAFCPSLPYIWYLGPDIRNTSQCGADVTCLVFRRSRGRILSLSSLHMVTGTRYQDHTSLCGAEVTCLVFRRSRGRILSLSSLHMVTGTRYQEHIAVWRRGNLFSIQEVPWLNSVPLFPTYGNWDHISGPHIAVWRRGNLFSIQEVPWSNFDTENGFSDRRLSRFSVSHIHML